jgi:hypothetical protein
MGAIRERKTVRSFVRSRCYCSSLNHKIPKSQLFFFIILLFFFFLPSFFSCVSFTAAATTIIFIVIAVFWGSPNLTAHLNRALRFLILISLERERGREAAACSESVFAFSCF